jgi:hypothetical protein
MALCLKNRPIRIECAILVVDTNIINPDPVLILAPIFGHGLISSRSIDRGPSPGDASARF